jgi:PspC domain
MPRVWGKLIGTGGLAGPGNQVDVNAHSAGVTSGSPASTRALPNRVWSDRRRGRVLGGVCAGLGRRFGLKPWHARILFVLLLMVIREARS